MALQCNWSCVKTEENIGMPDPRRTLKSGNYFLSAISLSSSQTQKPSLQSWLTGNISSLWRSMQFCSLRYRVQGMEEGQTESQVTESILCFPCHRALEKTKTYRRKVLKHGKQFALRFLALWFKFPIEKWIISTEKCRQLRSKDNC